MKKVLKVFRVLGVVRLPVYRNRFIHCIFYVDYCDYFGYKKVIQGEYNA